MFSRLFGRRKSDEAEPVNGVEATEEKPENINQDGFVVLDDPANPANGYSPAPGYSVGGANAFLPYGIDPNSTVRPATQRSTSFETITAIDGVPFKFGSNVMFQDQFCSFSHSVSTEHLMSKIKSFNWDDYEYTFELEKSVLRELISAECNQNY